MYMKVWSPLLDECLFGKKEPGNGVDNNTVAVICLNSCGKKEVVCHVPQNISKVVSLYLFATLFLELEITGKRVNGVGVYGLQLQQVFLFMGTKRPRSRPE